MQCLGSREESRELELSESEKRSMPHLIKWVGLQKDGRDALRQLVTLDSRSSLSTHTLVEFVLLGWKF